LSFLTRLRQLSAQAWTTVRDDSATGRRVRRVAASVTTALAGALVLFALIAPNQHSQLTPTAFVRIPVEGLLGVAVLLVLPPRARRVVAALAGAALGLLTILKILDLGFSAVFARPFDPMIDWTMFDPAVEYLTQSLGRAGAIGAVVVALVLAVAVPVLMTLSVLRLTRLAVRHKARVTPAVAVLAVAALIFAPFGVPVVPDAPVGTLAYDRVLQVHAGLQDKEAFAAEVAVDPFRDTPGEELLTALRGKDVIITFIESYGRDAIENPEYAPQVGAVLDAGDRRLRAAGFSSRSAFLTSSTVGGGSWWAHSTLLTGLWVPNQQRYRTLVSTDRLTLNGAFRRAGWRTVGIMPGITQDWPEGAFYGYDKIYAAKDVGYNGPLFALATMPDQFTLSAFERLEHGTKGRGPIMAEIPLTSSHSPWAPIPQFLDWDDVGDGSIFNPMAYPGNSPKIVLREPAQVRTDYGRSIEYSLNTLISYVERFGDENLVLVFLGDHQPTPLVTADDTNRDVPITILAHDPAVLDRISGWGWQEGLKPGPQAPVWPMHSFRDRFLTTFGPQAEPARPAAPAPGPAPPSR